MEIIDVDDPKHEALARRLEALMKRASGDDERDPLDYLLGALHGLIQAKRLKFKDRDHALHGAGGRSAEGIEYWEYGPLVRVRLMAKGQLRVDGAWVAGFYFNSAVVRLAAVFDRAVRRTATQKSAPPRGWGPPPPVWELLRALGLHQFTKGKLARVYEEANPLKHRPEGLAKRRRVSMAEATVAFEQLLDLLEHPKMR